MKLESRKINNELKCVLQRIEYKIVLKCLISLSLSIFQISKNKNIQKRERNVQLVISFTIYRMAFFFLYTISSRSIEHLSKKKIKSNGLETSFNQEEGRRPSIIITTSITLRIYLKNLDYL